jgi:hypothetical protein
LNEVPLRPHLDLSAEELREHLRGDVLVLESRHVGEELFGKDALRRPV